MTKKVFLDSLREKLNGLPKSDVDERISYYEEMIYDIMDDGKSEEEAVAEIGTVDEVVYEIAQDTPLTKIVKEKIRRKGKLKTWQIVLICVTFPFWLPIAIVLAVIGLVTYILFWVGVIVSYAIEVALIIGSIAEMIAFFGYLFSGNFNLIPLALAMLCAGGAVMMFFGCYWATRGTIKLHKKIFTWMKTGIIKKGGNNYE